MWNNVIVANIGWDEVYSGRAVASHHSYVVQHGTGGEAFNFQPYRGLFYGYIRDGSALDRFSHRLWTIVFVSKPSEQERLRIVGWYEQARVTGYRDRPEYAFEPSFPNSDEDQRYEICSVSKTAFLVPVEQRAALTLPQGHRIKSGGLYYAAGGDRADTEAQQASRNRMVEWLRATLPGLREDAALERSADADFPDLPGIIVDEGGKPHGFSPVPEGERHRRLKHWACRNAQEITGRALGEGRVEQLLLSGDRVDAAHEAEDALWLVEVKGWGSPPDDLRRGVYQCIKYRAVAAAQPDWIGRQISAVLLTERALPAELQALAEANGITLMVHELTAEDE
ncbi:hypothetical protein [Croceibacterium mercuriale]|uniref:hypothetical protein n=1 Tax=Croceibacterium mercuriale TaxID=1572751 RepID=UPI00126A1C74|nr:hypothetical protein [Croceibacterium mercuriale]